MGAVSPTFFDFSVFLNYRRRRGIAAPMVLQRLADAARHLRYTSEVLLPSLCAAVGRIGDRDRHRDSGSAPTSPISSKSSCRRSPRRTLISKGRRSRHRDSGAAAALALESRRDMPEAAKPASASASFSRSRLDQKSRPFRLQTGIAEVLNQRVRRSARG